MMRALWVICGVLAPCALAAADSAVLRKPSLHWTRGESALQCVDPRALSESVEELVGPVLVRAPDAEHTVEAQVSRVTPSVLRVQVRVLDVAGAKVGERTFEQSGVDCPALTPAIAFVIAMMIDPDVAAHGLPPGLVALLGGAEPAEDKLKRELEGEPPPAPPPPVLPAPAREPRPRRPTLVLDHELGAPPRAPLQGQQAALLARGALHETARGLVGVEARYLRGVLRPWFAAAGYIRGGRQLGLHSLGGGRAIEMTTLDVGLQACGGQLSAAQLRLLGCLGVELSTVFGTGHGYAPDRVQGLVNVGAVAQLTGRLRVWGRFGVMLSLSARAALSRRDFTYKNGDQDRVSAYRHHLVAGAVALGPSYEF
jgi:hypothetical protein